MMDKLHCPECGVHIDEHPAGRCLDVWVAETIGNKAVYEFPPGVMNNLPRYSTDIAAAWKVVEKITEPPKDIETSKRMSNTIFSRWFDTADLWACSASEASLKICHAVIRAKLG